MENESPDPQEEKFLGWFWCPHRQDFFRWSAFIEYIDNEHVKDENNSV